MATQFVSASHPRSSSTASPALRARQITHPAVAPPTGCRRGQREHKPLRDREKLLVELLPLVKSMALKIRERLPAHVEVEDLVSDGLLGLVDAVAKFDPGKRVKLETYARHRIRGSILDGLRSADPVPRDLRCEHKRVQSVIHELETKLGRPANDEEMAAGMGMTLAQWHRKLYEIQSAGVQCGARALSAGPASVQAPADPAFLASDDLSAFDLSHRREQGEILDRALSHLGQRERQIIILYYQGELTMQAIASVMNVDASRVSQLHATALARLKAHVEFLLHSSHAQRAKSGRRSTAGGEGPQSDS
jgi:RNA polymerase sigma factor FliA